MKTSLIVTDNPAICIVNKFDITMEFNVAWSLLKLPECIWDEKIDVQITLMRYPYMLGNMPVK